MKNHTARLRRICLTYHRSKHGTEGDIRQSARQMTPRERRADSWIKGPPSWTCCSKQTVDRPADHLCVIFGGYNGIT